jgi:hypothetical protein
LSFVGSEVLTAVHVKDTIFWDITLLGLRPAFTLFGLFDPEDGGDIFVRNVV